MLQTCHLFQKLLKKAIATQIDSHLINNDVVDHF